VKTSGGRFILKPADFSHIAKEIETIGTVRTLNFYMMGEPFINKHLIDFIKEAKDRKLGDRIIVTTNASLLAYKHYDALCASGLDFLRISIYGSNEKNYQHNTGVGAFERIRDNVIGFRDYRDVNGFAKPYIYVKMIESENNAENEQFIRAFANVGDEVCIEPIMNWNDSNIGELAQVEQKQLLARDYFARKKEVCPFPFYTLVIHSDLKVSVCCVDWNKKAVVGDLRNQSLIEIWRGRALHDFQLRHLERRRNELPGCRDCIYLHTAPDNLDDLKACIYAKRIER